MTKVEAIKKVMEDNNGLANWPIIYNETGNYYPNIKKPLSWKEDIRGVLYRELNEQKNFKKIDDGLFALLDYDEEALVVEKCLDGTETSTIAKIRKGQDVFRDKLLKKLKRCPVTEIDDERLLIASHIKPWALSNDSERLDANNGFLLSPTYDKLFGGGLITFSIDRKKCLYQIPCQEETERG